MPQQSDAASRLQPKIEGVAVEANDSYACASTWLLFPGINHFHHRAIVAQGRAAAELRNRRENVVHGSALGSELKALVIKEFAFSIFGFCNAVGHQNQSVTGMQAIAIALIDGIGEQANWQATVRRPNDLPTADQTRRNMAAVHVFEFAVAPQERDYHRGIFFTDAL